MNFYSSIACIALFGFNYGSAAFWLTAIVGVASHVEKIAMTSTLPRWIYDVLVYTSAGDVKPG